MAVIYATPTLPTRIPKRWRLCHLCNMASSESDDFQKVLEYRIYKCSSYSSCYIPEWVALAFVSRIVVKRSGNSSLKDRDFL